MDITSIFVCTLALLLLYILYTDGAHFGKKVVRAFYWFYTPFYDSGKLLTRLRNRQVREMLRAHILPLSGTHLDVATGTGRIIRILLNEKGWSGTHLGTDYTRRMIHYAMDKTPLEERHRVLYAYADANTIDCGSFTLVTCFEALELFDSPIAVLRRLMNHVEPGGYICFTKLREYFVPLIPRKGFSRKEVERVAQQSNIEMLVYKAQLGSRYEICIGRKLPTSTRTTTTR